MKSQLPFDSCRSFYIHIVIISLFTGLGTAQVKGTEQYIKQTGRPFIRNYSVREYRAQQQNWAIYQDKQGLIYFGNGGGLLTYDGHNWEMMKLAVMRSIDMDNTGRIYVGLENDAGYLEPDQAGNYLFRSFKTLLPEKYRDVTPVFSIYATGNRVIFMTNEYLAIYQDGKFKVIPSENGFHRTFNIRDRIYVRENGKGLFLLEGDNLNFVEGSGIFADERIYCMLPYGENEVMVVTMRQGSFIWSPDNNQGFSKPDQFRQVDQILSRNWPYCGITLPDGNFAVGTITAGIIIFSPEGHIIHIFDKNAGLQDNTVYNIFCDSDRNLWAALDNGISRIDYSLPFVHYTEQEGLYGSVLFVKYLDNQLYIGTGQYLHLQRPDGSFEIIPETDGQNFDLISAKNTILLAHNPGVFEVRGNRTFLVPGSSEITATCFGTLNNHPDHLLVGGMGIDLLEHGPGGWKVKNHIRGFQFPAYIIFEDSPGNIWVSSLTNLYKIRLNSSMDSVVARTEITAGKGMPEENASPYRLLSGEVIFSTTQGIYRYLAEKDSFVRHPDFLMINGKVSPFLQVDDGSIWFEEAAGSFNYQKGVLRPVDGQYQVYKTPFYKFNDSNCNESPPNVCVLPDGTVYFGTNLGLLKYQPEQGTYSERLFNTLIRKVYARDSLLFGGISTNMNPSEQIDLGEISWTSNDLFFHFAAQFYEDSEKNQYSYRLSGLDNEWSSWSSDHKKEYTNLREGRYSFEVKSKNQYLVEGDTATCYFTILPPWYRTWLAYLAYALLGGSGIYLLLYLRTKNLKARSISLEKTVRERTNQIREQKNNVDKLSKIGRDITSSLSIENIIKTVYENVNTLMDASVFTIGLHKTEGNCLEFPAAIEKGELLPSFSIPLSDENRLAVWCFNNREEVVVNDYEKDYKKYVGQMSAPIAGESPESVLYLPLCSKDKAIGVISAQSFNKNAYTDYHLNMLRNLATYSAIALENADAYRRLAALLDELRSAQNQLVTQSKLAALGELTAGIAHEIQNPLNFVNNFSEISNELMDELKEELAKGNQDEGDSLIHNIKQNLEKISYHGKRADSIVKNMLMHSQGSIGLKQVTDINSLCEEYLRLSYHGFRAKDKSLSDGQAGFHAEVKTYLDPNLPKINVVPQDIGRVLLNLINNAFYAVSEVKTTHALSQPSPVKTLHAKSQQPPDNPCVIVATKNLGNKIEIRIKDNGRGIPASIVDKIFQPFFTTKPTGQGTGLGLSLAYDMVKAHGGDIKVETKEGEGTEFIIFLPYS